METENLVDTTSNGNPTIANSLETERTAKKRRFLSKSEIALSFLLDPAYRNNESSCIHLFNHLFDILASEEKINESASDQTYIDWYISHLQEIQAFMRVALKSNLSLNSIGDRIRKFMKITKSNWVEEWVQHLDSQTDN